LEASWPLQALLEEVITASLHGLVQPVQHAHSALPIHTRVGNGNTVLQARRTLSGNVLASGIDMRLDHDTSNVLITSGELGADVINYFWLIVMILLRVAI
jgi:tetrahydromethanopterin S-methyltransferase subunit D